jgi:hypothetical protein
MSIGYLQNLLRDLLRDKHTRNCPGIGEEKTKKNSGPGTIGGD